MSYTPKGTAQTFLNVAVDTGFGDKKETVWVSLASWGLQAELLNNSLVKGNRISFTAEVTAIRTYEKKDGSTGVSVDAKILNFAFVDYNKKDEKNTPTPYDEGEEPDDGEWEE